MLLLVNGVMGLLMLLYPLAVFYGNQYYAPKKIAALLIALLLVRLVLSYSSKHWNIPLLIAGIGYCGFAMWSNQPSALRFYPVLMNAVMLLVFIRSLWSPQSLVESLARLRQPNLPPEGIIYTRRVTKIWCVFFILNGAIALATSLWASLAVWSLYNGLISYLLIGLLMGSEYLIRRRTQKYAG